MKKIVLTGVVSLLLLSGVALAVQSEEQKSRSNMHGMMEQMKGGNGMEGMGGMEGMMRMMKMMDQCADMMESSHHSEQPGEGEKK